MDLSTILTKSPDAAFRTYDGQATIVLPSRAQVSVLNEVGSAVWERIDGRRTLQEILDGILEEFDITRDQALGDLETFVADLRAQGMVS
ncbi:MAG TPA: PqqD family protein [Candidatus Polarisedimenticolia bacterium]|nr:PqqD family protein [Candidatus Polarisedimenticolia bacterium]